MKVIIDANIFISALITPKGKIADLLLDPFNKIEKYSCHYLYVEILKHKSKILKCNKLNEDDFLDIIYIMLQNMTFYNELQISKSNWQEAEILTKDIDHKDIAYVALSLQLDADLWTGDKPLLNGLKAKGFKKVIDTAELIKLIE
jgi:predicted nucleic acid-binding protein